MYVIGNCIEFDYPLQECHIYGHRWKLPQLKPKGKLRTKNALVVPNYNVSKNGKKLEEVYAYAKDAGSDFKKVRPVSPIPPANYPPPPQANFVSYTIAKASLPDPKEEAVLQCLQSLLKLKHASICRFERAFEDPRNLYLVYERCWGGEFFQTTVLEGKLTEKMAAWYARQIASALAMAHKCEIPHGNLKTKNLLLEHTGKQAVLKITDFAVSNILKPGPMDARAAESLFHVAPELVDQHERQFVPEATTESDIWSFGVLLMFMLTGQAPFGGRDATAEDCKKQILKGAVDFSGTEWDRLHPDALLLVRSMLQFEAEDRPTAQSILSSPWVKLINQLPSKKLGTGIVKKLQQYTRMQDLKKSCVKLLALQLPQDKIDDLHHIFEEMDTSGDGQLSFDELRLGIEKLAEDLDFEIPEDVDSMFKDMDVDDDVGIAIKEFIDETRESQMLMNKDVLWRAFKECDDDQSGSIEKDELEKIFSSVGTILGPAQVDKLRTAMDTDDNGKITFDEFIAALNKGTAVEGLAPQDSGKSLIERLRAIPDKVLKLCTVNE